MKRINPVIVTLLIVIATGCSKNEDPDARAEFIKFLTSGVWVPDKIVNSEDGDLTQQFEDFTIVFVKNQSQSFDGEYFNSNGGRVFPDGSGGWQLSADLSTLNFSDGREAEIEKENGRLIIRVDVVPSGGRVDGIDGRFTMVLKLRE